MGNIPLVTGQISARTGRTEGQINSYATADEFGAQIGRAAQGAGQQVTDLGAALRYREEKKANEKAANAAAQFDFSRQEAETRNEVGPDGAGLQEKTLQKFDAEVDKRANEIDDDIARTKFKNAMADQRLQISARSVSQEFTLDAAWSKSEAEASLMALENKIMSDPAMYDTFIDQGMAVLDTRRGMNANMRENMKLAWKQKSASARFTGMLEAATSVADIDAAAAELTGASSAKGKGGKDDFAGRDWSKELSPQDFETLVNNMGTARKAFVTKADADARAAIDTIETRAKDVTTLIPRDELKAIGSLVKQSQNPVTIAQYARIVRDQDIIEQSRKLPVPEQRAIINGSKGDPNTSIPGVPARVSTAINTAAGKFDVSASYLSATTQREYGQFYTRTKRETNTKFAPIAAHGNVDLRNVRPDVVEAATVAGELFGQPLQATSGYRSQAKQNAIRAKGDPNRVTVAKESHHTDATALDISTAGMSAADRGRLAASLVDAGFTGIGEYDSHMHADFREAVPSSFGDSNGKTWGGWTYLSPEVATALKERGFAKGASSKSLKRSAPVQYADDIDYGRGTTILKDDGRPSSGAEGVMQFIPGTFLGIMKNPSIAARIGVDTSGMSDDAILALRKNPEISMLAGAALAEQNKKAMRGALGRDVNDAELYMAHFLGSGGAVALLGAKSQQGAQSAAKLLPNAAAANRPVFYDKSGRERSVDEVYANLTSSFVASPSKVSYDDVQTRQRVLENTEKELKDNPMQHARDVGSHDVPEFSVENMSAYGQAVRSVSEYYNLPMNEMKVLDDDALNVVKKVLDEGTVDDTLSMITAMQDMGGDVARAALKQLGEKDNVYAFAGGMNLDTGESAIASDVIRGQKRLNENAALKDEVGATDKELTQAFRQATGNSLNEVAPKARQDIQDAALAYYVETVLSRGKGAAFDQKAYESAVATVLSNGKGTPSVGEVNGETTVLPPGVSADDMNDAMQRMTVTDWADLSEDGEPPRYIDGSIIDPADLADEAKLRSIGGGQYKLQLDDGTFAVTSSRGPNGRLAAYIFEPDAKRITEISKRATEADNGYEPRGDEPTGYFAPNNPLGNFDDNGRWVGPK